ncbi:MAG: HlyD family efflux transporter periplasmic adaptor subunit [Paracoccaceae bacterium]
MRYWRLILGLSLFSLALWVIFGEQLAGASADAVVNAEVVIVRAPISGSLSVKQVPLGAILVKGDGVGSVSNPIADTIRQNDLVMEASVAEANVAHFIASIDDLNRRIGVTKQHITDFKAAQLVELSMELDHAKTRLMRIEAAGTSNDVAAEIATEPGNVAPGGQNLPSIAQDIAQERVDLLTNQIAAVENDVREPNGQGAFSYFQQHLDTLQSMIDDQTEGLAEAKARLVSVKARLMAEQLRTAKESSQDIRSPVNGPVWERLASDGEAVQRGDDLLRVADCDSAIVTLSVTENVYNRLQIGLAARFRFQDSSKVYDAAIIRLGGAGAVTLYRNLAVSPSQKHLERFDVALVVPDLRNVPELRCLIGRTGRVFFDQRPFDWLRNWVR